MGGIDELRGNSSAHSSAHSSLELGIQLIESRARHRIRRFVARMDAVGLVCAGRKRIGMAGEELRFDPGDLFLIPRGSTLDVVNDPAGKPAYFAQVLCYAPEPIERFRSQYPELAARPTLTACRRLKVDAGMRDAFARAVAALQDPAASDNLRRLCASEVLLRLAESHASLFAGADALSWSDRVRRAIAQRPAHGWTLDALAGGLHVGASTLQRRLAEEGTSVRDCLRETRLETALGLLQAGRLSVAEIAHACGYAAHGRFSLAFKARYGFAPSTLRPLRGAAHSD